MSMLHKTVLLAFKVQSLPHLNKVKLSIERTGLEDVCNGKITVLWINALGECICIETIKMNIGMRP
jgi:hypothetical protein